MVHAKKTQIDAPPASLFRKSCLSTKAGQRLRSRRHRLLRMLCTWRILAGTGVRSPDSRASRPCLAMGAPLYTFQADDRHACSGIPWQGFAQRLPSCPHSSVGKRLCRGGCTWGLACSLSKGHGQISGAAISPCHSRVKCMLRGSGWDLMCTQFTKPLGRCPTTEWLKPAFNAFT